MNRFEHLKKQEEIDLTKFRKALKTEEEPNRLAEFAGMVAEISVGVVVSVGVIMKAMYTKFKDKDKWNDKDDSDIFI